jgi:hypothetical protein
VFDDERGMNWPTEEEGGSRHKKKEVVDTRRRSLVDTEMLQTLSQFLSKRQEPTMSKRTAGTRLPTTSPGFHHLQVLATLLFCLYFQRLVSWLKSLANSFDGIHVTELRPAALLVLLTTNLQSIPAQSSYTILQHLSAYRHALTKTISATMAGVVMSGRS